MRRLYGVAVLVALGLWAGVPAAEGRLKTQVLTVPFRGGSVEVPTEARTERPCVAEVVTTFRRWRRCPVTFRVTVGASTLREWNGIPVVITQGDHHSEVVIEQEPDPLHGVANQAITDPLGPCGAGCYRPFARREFPAHGNRNAGDCEYAAIAAWIELTQRRHVSTAEVLGAFAAHGPLDFPQTLETYGMAGLRAKLVLVASPREAVKSALRSHRALYAGFSLPAGVSLRLGDTVMQNASHAVLLDGFTSQAVQVVSWGRTYMVPWTEWEATRPDVWFLTPTYE